MLTVREHMNTIDSKRSTTYMFVGTNIRYNPFTKKGTLRADTDRYYVMYNAEDCMGNHIAYVKKCATKDELEAMGFCANHNGKMEGIFSLSTSPLINPRCLVRSKNLRTICAYCYSIAMQGQYDALQKKLMKNVKVWTEQLIDIASLPIIKNEYGRFESFGDLLNVTQVANYVNIARLNDHVNFALWTKNPDILAQYFDMGYTKPSNLQIIYSSPYKNVVDMDIMKKYWFIDKVFTVWDSAEIAHENGYEINCGKRDCFKCHKCYITNDIELIHELLK